MTRYDRQENKFVYVGLKFKSELNKWKVIKIYENLCQIQNQSGAILEYIYKDSVLNLLKKFGSW